MKIDFTQKLTTLDGTQIKAMKNDEPLTLKHVVTDSLLSTPQGQTPDSPQAMVENYDLSLRIQKAKEPLSITIDEAKKIKDKVASKYNALVYGQIHHILEGE